MNKKYYVLIGLIVSAIALVIGTSYAYFMANVTGGNDGNETVIKSGNLSLTLTDNETLSLNGIPGDSASKQFTVTNNGTNETVYNIKMVDVTNTFVDKNDLVYTLVGDNDVNITETVMPSTSDEYLATNISIDSGVTHTYTLVITFKETNDNQDDNKGATFSGRINIDNGHSLYTDSTGAAMPELYQGLIPVTYDESGNVIIADVYSEWYDYTKHNWANAILVNNDDPEISSKYFDGAQLKNGAVGSIVPMEDILQMYVWIPRYKYKLWNAENGTSDEQAIEIVFESKDTPKSNGNTNGTWLTHPAFTFGDTELNGIWVGKFEPSNGTLSNSNDLTNIQIKPNVVSMVNVKNSDSFNAVRNIELQYARRYNLNQNEVDTHMMKNMEWGAVAYLSSSVYGRYNSDKTCISSGCEIWSNNVRVGTGCGYNNNFTISACGGTITGCSGNSVSSASFDNTTACYDTYEWNHNGINSSTTGNIFGIYDMSGGTAERVMGIMATTSGVYSPSYVEDNYNIESKYYDLYNYGTSETDHARGKLGDATKETLKIFGGSRGGWYGADSLMPINTVNVGFGRGGGAYKVANDVRSIFIFSRVSGGESKTCSFRIVLTAEDK